MFLDTQRPLHICYIVHQFVCPSDDVSPNAQLSSQCFFRLILYVLLFMPICPYGLAFRYESWYLTGNTLSVRPSVLLMKHLRRLLLQGLKALKKLHLIQDVPENLFFEVRLPHDPVCPLWYVGPSSVGLFFLLKVHKVSLLMLLLVFIFYQFLFSMLPGGQHRALNDCQKVASQQLSTVHIIDKKRLALVKITIYFNFF